ncbi:MAG: alpha/beta hydrolase [Pseudomonadota bacterium]|nr:alpha/beta hydrolase [Pseudomonadota bacterium]
MAETVYRNYDSTALYAQYNNREQISKEVLAAIKADQNDRSAEYRKNAIRKRLDVQYGRHPRERLDVFLPDGDKAPLFAFIHGGYWQWNDKEGFEFLAKELNAAGAAFANIEYALCPDVSLGELADQCRRAIAHLWLEADQYGYDRNRIVVSGHSAGGHLTAMMQATDWPEFGSGLQEDVVAAGLPISGIYDLEPIRLIPLNDAIRLEAGDIAALSPMFLSPVTKSQTVVAFGGAEYDEFHRQAADLAENWGKLGVQTSTINMAGRDHFTALSALAEPDHELFIAAKKLLDIN